VTDQASPEPGAPPEWQEPLEPGAPPIEGIEARAVSLELAAVPVVSYAMAHNRVSVVTRLVLRNHGVDLRAVTVRLAVRDAEGGLSVPWQRLVDLPVHGEVRFEDVDLFLDPATMLQVEEQRPGTVIAWVTSVNATQNVTRTVAEQRVAVRILAASQWEARPVELGLEMLAAFVMPNSPAVAALMPEVAQRLQERTGSGSIEGYQAGPERVDEIAQAVFEVMAARRIRYSQPPASWADDGQKIRNPHEVLVERVGTCLDLVVTMAAALERAGIGALIWMVEGHAFLGYWREDRSLSAIAQTEVTPVVNLVDLGLIRLVETTILTAADPSVIRFENSATSPYREYLSGDLSRVVGVCDVRSARTNAAVIPLPARVREADGTVSVIEYNPPPRAPAPQRELRPGAVDDRAGRPEVPPRVQQWKNALLDLTLRNRLINYTERSGVSLVIPGGGLGIMENLVSSRRALTLLPSDQIDEVQRARGVVRGADLPPQLLADLLYTKSMSYVDVASAGYPARLRGLAYKAKTLIEETGSNNLYLALGSLIWTFDNRQLRSPLILVPVRLSTRSQHQTYRLELDESGSSTPNFCLLEKLRMVHDLVVPGLAEPVTDQAGINLDEALRAMRVALADASLPFRVEETADLSILQFAKFRLWKDLDEGWSTLASNPLVNHLMHSPAAPFADPVPAPEQARDLDELGARCPAPADASQLLAVADAVAGRTFVLEGPPGTGKSQTITNLLTEAIRQGRRVLFVAEKRAALDVVRERLHAVGMGPFALDLHDKGSKPSAVRAQIRAATEHTVTVDEQGLAADQEHLRSSRGQLSRYAQRLHEPNGAGLSFYSAHTQCLTLGEFAPQLPVPPALLHGSAEAVTRIRRLLTTLPDTADLAHPAPDHPWGFVGPGAGGSLDVGAMRAAVEAMDRAMAGLPQPGPLGAAVRAARSPEDLSALAGLVEARIPVSVLDRTRSETWHSAADAVLGQIDGFVAAQPAGLEVVTVAALDLDLAEIQRQAGAAAESFWWGRRKRLREVGRRLTPVLRPGVELPPKKVLPVVTALLRVQTEARELAARAHALVGVEVPASWHPLRPGEAGLVRGQVEWLVWAGRAVDPRAPKPERGEFLAAVRAVLDSPEQADPDRADLGLAGIEQVEAVRRAADAATVLADLSGGDPDRFERWSSAGDGSRGDHGLAAVWPATSAGRELADPGLLPLRRWIAFLDHLAPLTEAGLETARIELITGRIQASDAVRAFDLGLARASRLERAEATGLSTFDAQVHQRAIVRFTRSAAAVRTELISAAASDVISNRALDVHSGLGQMGGLRRELGRQRGGLGVRGLIGTYGELITALMPCVLVSPDSLARFFPVSAGAFDLVVFDEASQIRVADAVGAMGRAGSVVVVGDSKQMPPTAFAEPANDDEGAADDPLNVEDEESILSECVMAQVPRNWLTWHYRSQDESLIAFSNQRYYEGKLSSFPAPRTGKPDPGPGGRGISLVRVNGHFHRSGAGKLLRTNPEEADAVVADIRRRFDAVPAGETPSIGVVTFNQQQRAYIEALIRDGGDARLAEALDAPDGEGLFIKNLENVQGDERDVILFSTAFSVNQRGALPLNFGPLNRGGGERRLNVAITRARCQVVVFSSFAPEQLRAEETSSIGIKHLRAYLELAAGGPDTLARSSSRRAVRDRHRDQLAEQLRERGLEVTTDVGLSEFRIDLTLARPENRQTPKVAVLLDGPEWAARRTTSDRDGLPVEVLSHMLKWPAVERVWMPSWLQDPASILDHLDRVVRDAERPAAAPVANSDPDAARHAAEPETVIEDSGVSWPDSGPAQTLASSSAEIEPGSTSPVHRNEVPFVAWTPGRIGGRGVLDALPKAAAVRAVRAALLAGIEAEGPIQIERLAKAVAGAFDLTRLSEARLAAIVAVLPAESVPDPDEPFAWPSQVDPESWTQFRTAAPGRPPDQSQRPLDAVCLREIGNAMVTLCRASGGIRQPELFKQVLAAFGGKRVTGAVSARLGEALARGQAGARLEQRPDGLIVSRESR
jgi:hypothetical protein